VVEITAAHVGGFYGDSGHDGSDSTADKTPDNTPSHENYFVGYSTSAGETRTPERRAFFVFPLSSVTGTVVSAELTLHLAGPDAIHFGKGPGTPGVDAIAEDTTETFQLGVTSVPTPAILATPVDLSTAFGIFETFNDTPIAPPVTFGPGGMPPPMGMPAEVVIPLDAGGVAALNAALAGGDIVLTGWMPSWTEDFRLAPGAVDPDDWFEGSEFFFGFSDTHKTFPKPFLSVTFAPVPEAGAAKLLAGVAFLGSTFGYVSSRRRRGRQTVEKGSG
jgi:hypothetical protein